MLLPTVSLVFKFEDINDPQSPNPQKFPFLTYLQKTKSNLGYIELPTKIPSATALYTNLKFSLHFSNSDPFLQHLLPFYIKKIHKKIDSLCYEFTPL